MYLRKEAFGNIVGKGENAGISVFCTFSSTIPLFESILICLLQILARKTSLKRF